MAHSIF